MFDIKVLPRLAVPPAGAYAYCMSLCGVITAPTP